MNPTDVRHMHVAQRFFPDVVGVVPYPRDNPDDIVRSAQQYAKEANTGRYGPTEQARLREFAAGIIGAGNFAVRLTVIVPPEVIHEAFSEASPTAAFDAQVHQFRILAN